MSDVQWCLRPMAAVVTLAAMLFGPSAAVADGKLLLGGGAGIVVDGSYCTLTTIGHDKTGELVGFTAAHCGGPGAQVVAEGTDGTVGSVVATNIDLDYAVLKFDPTKVTPIPDFDGFAINGIGPDPGFLQPACTQGAATGYGCGSVTVPTLKRPGVTARVPSWQPGDDGAPVTVDGRLVGMTRGGYTIVDVVIPHVEAHIGLTLFSAIVDDVNTSGGPGAGFVPVPV